MKPSTMENVWQLQSHSSHEEVAGRLEMAARQAADPQNVGLATTLVGSHV
jgi:hypothetical protein